jgi:DNA-binding IclR family transcriptional regulator
MAAMPEDALGPVARALHILRALAEAEEPQSATELAGKVSLPSSTTHRLLQLLREQGMVELAPGTRRYRPGLEYYRLGALVAAKQPVAEAARPFMREVVDEVDETCLLGLHLPPTQRMMFAEQVESTQALRFAIPMRTPVELVWGCSGRVIVAQLPEADVRSALAKAGPSPVLGTRPPKVRDFGTELESIRFRGWDLTRGEKIADSVGIAAPVFGTRGVLGSLSLTIPAVRFAEGDRTALAKLLVERAGALSAALGPGGPDHSQASRSE